MLNETDGFDKLLDQLKQQKNKLKIPNPQSPIPNPQFFNIKFINIIKLFNSIKLIK